MIKYNLIRSKRKTIAIHIVDGELAVKASLKMPQADIDKFVNSKKSWIDKNLSNSIVKKEQKESFALNYGDSILLMGKSYFIIGRQGSSAGFDGRCFFVPEDLSSEKIKQLIINTYKAFAKNYILSRVIVFADKMSLEPKSAKITSAAARWGSCSSKGCLNFSWRLVMADEDVVDYLVVHELAHLKVMNHSKKFWVIVQNVLPNYKVMQAKLRILSKKLSVENWS